MGRDSRHEQEIRRRAAAGFPVSGSRTFEPDGRWGSLAVTASVLAVADGYQCAVDFYRLAGATVEDVREDRRTFATSDEALDHLAAATGIPVHDLKS